MRDQDGNSPALRSHSSSQSQLLQKVALRKCVERRARFIQQQQAWALTPECAGDRNPLPLTG